MTSIPWKTVGLLILSNFMMLYAWYGPLRSMGGSPIWKIILVSWSIALFEYCIAVPANRIGMRTLSLEQLKIIQEAVALITFVPFSLLIMRQPVTWNYAAAALCIFGAVFFIFRG